jgi:hypothetical protein
MLKKAAQNLFHNDILATKARKKFKNTIYGAYKNVKIDPK